MISVSDAAAEAGVELVGKVEDMAVYIFRHPNGVRFSCKDRPTSDEQYVRHLKFHAHQAAKSVDVPIAVIWNLAETLGLPDRIPGAPERETDRCIAFLTALAFDVEARCRIREMVLANAR